MHNGVLPQIGSPGESLLALGTNKGFREAVQVSQVLLQHRSLVAAEQTEDAVVRLVGVVLGLFVLAAVLLELESQVTELAQVEGLLVVRQGIPCHGHCTTAVHEMMEAALVVVHVVVVVVMVSLQ